MQGGFLVSTTNMLGTGEVIRVAVIGGVSECVVSDQGLAIRELEMAGAEVRNPERLLRPYAKRYGIEVSGTDLYVRIPTEDVAAAIMLVSGACREAYDGELRRIRFAPRRDLREALSRFLKSTPLDLSEHKGIITGKNAQHEFAHVFETHDQSGLVIVDSVLPEPSSINSRVVAHLDIRAALEGRAEQFVIYDDEDDWSSDKLGLIQLAAPIIPFSKIGGALLPYLQTNSHSPVSALH